ncbi:MAG: hypothetical protein PHS79_03290 [Patescibacteria group bacterium]|nr:hypothetical protein [Patescibacteria group bacterium]
MLLNRRRIALVLIVLGLLLLGFGAWILVGLLWPKTPGDQTANREPQIVQRDTQPQPRTIALPTTVQGTSTGALTGEVSSIQDSLRKAGSVVSRMGSGTNQDGFLGYNDAMSDGTVSFRSYLTNEQRRLVEGHPLSAGLYGMTTRVVASSVVSGTEGAASIVVKVQSQKVEDAGDRSKPTNVSYEESTVTLLKQTDGAYLVDAMSVAPYKP